MTEIKAFIFLLGASLGIVGMVTQRDWLVLFAIALLAVGVVVRLIHRRRQEREE